LEEDGNELTVKAVAAFSDFAFNASSGELEHNGKAVRDIWLVFES
jgi:hypothetical protein